MCTHYANFGSIIGKVAIVDTAPDTLLSISSSLLVATKFASTVTFPWESKAAIVL